MRVEKISPIQVFSLFFLTIYSTLIFFFPPVNAGADGWISGLLASGYLLLLVVIISVLYKKAPGRSIIQLLEPYPVLRLIILIVILFYLVILNVVTLTDLREVVALEMLQETPVTAVLITAMAIVFAAIRQGIEVIARIAEFLLPLVTLMVVFNLIIILPEIELAELKPVLESGWRPAIRGSLNTFDFIGFKIGRAHV